MNGQELSHAVQLFVEQHSVLQNLSPKTVKNNRNTMKLFMDFLGGRPFNLKVETTNHYRCHGIWLKNYAAEKNMDEFLKLPKTVATEHSREDAKS